MSPTARPVARRAAVAAGVVLALAASAGCEPDPATQLVVVVDSDLGVPGELSSLEARVLDTDGATVSEQRLELVGSADQAGPARFTLPLSFGVVPKGGDTDRRVEVVVAGFASGGGDAVVQRRAVTGFVEGQSLVLPVFLARACVGTSCPKDQTCSRRGCVPVVVPTEELARVDPGDELSVFDGGTGDASADGRADGGPYACASSCADGCVERACTAGEPCECVGEPCHCALGCGPDGCDARCDSTCVVDGRDGGDVAVQCDSARCTVDCRGADSCELACQPGSDCLVRCEAGGSCAITGCTGMLRTCEGDDRVLVCGRPCP